MNCCSVLAVYGMFEVILFETLISLEDPILRFVVLTVPLSFLDVDLERSPPLLLLPFRLDLAVSIGS